MLRSLMWADAVQPGRGLLHAAEEIGQFPHRDAPVGNGVFLGLAHVGKGAAATVGDKD